MIYKIEDVKRDVRICLDQNFSSQQLIDAGDIDTLSLNEIIQSKILEAVIRIHSDAPVYLLEQGHNFGDPLFWSDQGSGWILLPDDFMRLIVFEMSDWNSPVFAAISPVDPLYTLQRQRVKALRGTSQKPVCAITVRPEGKALEFYSCKTENAFVTKAQYLPYPSIDDSDGIDICQRCYHAIIYMAASLVLITLGENDKAIALSELSKTTLK